MKILTSSDWFEEIGTTHATAYEYLRNLDPHQEVDYLYMLNLFQKSRKTVMSKLPQKK